MEIWFRAGSRTISLRSTAKWLSFSETHERARNPRREVLKPKIRLSDWL